MIYEVITWASVKDAVRDSPGSSNRQLADNLRAHIDDVRALTNLMVKAGELRARYVKSRLTDQKATRVYELVA